MVMENMSQKIRNGNKKASGRMINLSMMERMKKTK